eukprot:TRINITY_DN9724_c0_g1_i1.p1 TRINITY_DN9724_c0_g1~~TRINITY_DN9724_c0_g1_i1.p1  ORF type:complete len:118 (-),score=31.21 TRINITY_DN9724_c0_g1_i1:148-501(-)
MEVAEVLGHVIKVEVDYTLKAANLLPHHKRNDFVSKLKKSKLVEIEQKILETKSYIDELLQYKGQLTDELKKFELLVGKDEESDDEEESMDRRSMYVKKTTEGQKIELDQTRRQSNQ